MNCFLNDLSVLNASGVSNVHSFICLSINRLPFFAEILFVGYKAIFFWTYQDVEQVVYLYITNCLDLFRRRYKKSL